MTSARASLWRPLYVSAVLGAAGSVASHGTPAALPGRSRPERSCNPAWCALARPTEAEFHAIVAEAGRILSTYVDDDTPLGRQCYALGVTMRDRAADVRMIDYMWRATDLDGNVGPVTGDAHLVAMATGTGNVHIARGYDALNPDRGMPAILQTARHEFAHLNGLRQSAGGVDSAAQLAIACGPP